METATLSTKIEKIPGLMVCLKSRKFLNNNTLSKKPWEVNRDLFSSTYLTNIIVMLVVSLLPVVITLKLRDNITDSDRNELPKMFLSSPIVLGIVSLNYGISLLWLYLPLSFPNREIMDWIIFSTIAFVWFVSTIFIFNRVKNSKVIITQHELEFRYGRKIKIVKLEDIMNVNSINGYITIDTIRKKNEIMIPMIFQDTSKIISYLM